MTTTNSAGSAGNAPATPATLADLSRAKFIDTRSDLAPGAAT